MVGCAAEISTELSFCWISQKGWQGDKCLLFSHDKHFGLVHETSKEFEDLDFVSPIECFLSYRDVQVLDMNMTIDGCSR